MYEDYHKNEWCTVAHEGCAITLVLNNISQVKDITFLVAIAASLLSSIIKELPWLVETSASDPE